MMEKVIENMIEKMRLGNMSIQEKEWPSGSVLVNFNHFCSVFGESLH